MEFQISAQILDFCVLAIVDREDVYGYSLTQKLMEAISISESTLYPVLRRLRKDELLETYDRQHDGRNRRYYRITDEGRKRLAIYRESWKAYVDSVEQIVHGRQV